MDGGRVSALAKVSYFCDGSFNAEQYFKTLEKHLFSQDAKQFVFL